jgi:hypothetical protein
VQPGDPRERCAVGLAPADDDAVARLAESRGARRVAGRAPRLRGLRPFDDHLLHANRADLEDAERRAELGRSRGDGDTAEPGGLVGGAVESTARLAHERALVARLEVGTEAVYDQAHPGDEDDEPDREQRAQPPAVQRRRGRRRDNRRQLRRAFEHGGHRVFDVV